MQIGNILYHSRNKFGTGSEGFASFCHPEVAYGDRRIPLGIGQDSSPADEAGRELIDSLGKKYFIPIDSRFRGNDKELRE